MGFSRITSSFLIDKGVSDVGNHRTVMARLQEKIASGQNIVRPSDDPIGLTQLLRLEKQLAADNQFKQNIDVGLSELATAEGALDGIMDVANRAKELAVQAANGTNSTQQHAAIEAEIESLIDQLVRLGNTQFGDTYVFSGFLTDTPPFTVAGQDVLYVGSPNTTPADFERRIQIAPASTVPINFNGEDILGTVNVLPGGPVGSGLLFDLRKLQIDLANNDFDAIRADLDLIDADTQNVSNIRTRLGATFNRLELTKNRIEDRELVLTEQIANLQDIDLATTISNFSFQQNLFEASVSVLAQVLNTSVLNFLR